MSDTLPLTSTVESVEVGTSTSDTLPFTFTSTDWTASFLNQPLIVSKMPPLPLLLFTSTFISFLSGNSLSVFPASLTFCSPLTLKFKLLFLSPDSISSHVYFPV